MSLLSRSQIPDPGSRIVLSDHNVEVCDNRNFVSMCFCFYSYDQGALGLVVKSSLPMRWPRVRFPKGAILQDAVKAPFAEAFTFDG